MKSGVFAILAACLSLEANAATIINNVEITPDSSFGPPGSFMIGYHGFPEALFTPTSNSGYQLSYFGIAEEFAFYSVTFGDLIDPFFVQQAVRLISNTNNPGTAEFDIGINESRYLGYWADEIDYYGWVRVSRTSTGLVAAESATSIGLGIRVGSLVEVPEPSAAVFAPLAFGLLLRRTRTPTPPRANKTG